MDFIQHTHISKISPPHLTGVLERPRLAETLEKHQDKRLILILGQAAQGKTTLAASYAARCDIPTAWISLGTEDRDTVNLVHTLARALLHAHQELDLSVLLHYPASTLALRDEVALHREWVNLLLEPIDFPLQIVLDGLDRLPQNAPAWRFIRIMLDHLPTHIRLLMLSRHLPAPDIEIFTKSQESLLLSNEDLAFSLSEADEFFRKLYSIHLSPKQLRIIHQTTEGWVGGLVLLSDFLGRLAGRTDELFVSNRILDKFSREAFDYFGEEILGSLPAHISDLLLKSSILSIIDPALAAGLSGRADAEGILLSAADRNLFLQKVYDPDKGWLFECHQLFREFLQARLKVSSTPEERQTLFLQTGAFLEEKGELEEAVRYYLEAHAYGKAMSIIEAIGMTLIGSGRTGDLSDWIERIPHQLIRANPWMLFYRFMTRRFMSLQEHLADIVEAYALFKERKDVKGLLLTLAHLIEASVAKGHSCIPPCHSLLEEAEAEVQSQQAGKYPFERATLWYYMSLAYHIRLGNPLKGVWSCENAYRLAKKMGDLPLQIHSLINLYFCLSGVAEFSRAEQIAKKVDKLLKKCPYPELRAIHCIYSCQIHWFRGDFHRMSDRLQEALQEIEQYGINYLYPIALLYSVICQQHLGRYHDAIQTAENLVRLADAASNRWMQGNALLQSAFTYYFMGEALKARDFFEIARETLASAESRADFHLQWTHAGLALTAYHFGTNGGAEEQLQRVIGSWQHNRLDHFLREVYLAMALLKWQRGQTQETVENLEAGLRLAQERGFDAVLLLSREDMLRICVLALELGLDEYWDYVFRCLTTKLAALAEPELKKLARHKDLNLAVKVRDIRTAIHRAKAPRLRMQTLGGFRLHRGTDVLEEDDWTANQPKLLLKAIIARGSVKVPKESLIEDLWPKISDAAGDRNFRVIMHRLRKTLEPSMSQEFGSCYVQQQANLVSLDAELCRVDVNDFLATLNQGKKVEQESSKKALAAYENALKMYRGDFLAEELYSPWAMVRRDELRGKYLNLLFRVAALYQQMGRTKKAIQSYRKVLQTDPLEEQAYQKLMLLYLELGMRNKALKLYQDCTEALQQGLQTMPDETTISIYRKVVESA